MTGFKLLRTVAMLATFTVAQPQTYGPEGREVAARPSSAARMNDHGPSQRGEPMWVHGAVGGRGGRKNALSPWIGTPHGNAGNKAPDDWPADMILG